MTRLVYISDLHLEMAPGDHKYPDVFSYVNMGCAGADTMLVIAGDLTQLRLLQKNSVADLFLRSCSAAFGKVLWVAGNHEFYGSDIKTKASEIRDQLSESDVYFVHEPEVIQFGGKKILAGTAWSSVQGGPYVEWFVSNHIADFTLVSTGSRKFRVQDCQKLYSQFYTALARHYSEVDCVVTHFLPSALSVHEKHRTGFSERLNSYFANSALDWLYAQNAETSYPPVWIHGHTHTPMDYVHPCGTRVVCNPWGYHNENPPSEFNREPVIEI